MSERYSAAWWNERIENAFTRVTPTVEKYARTMLQDGYSIGQAPVTWAYLQEKDAIEAIGIVTRMIEQPAEHAAGVKFLRKIVEQLEARDGEPTF